MNSNDEGVTIPVKTFDPHLHPLANDQTHGWNESNVWDSNR